MLSVGWMLEEMDKGVASSSFLLMGTNRVRLRVIAFGRGGREQQYRSYTEGGYLLHRNEI